MSDPTPQPLDAATQELVAYLDGELPAAAAQRVEERLATDEEYRRQLGELDQAWSALDALPTPTVDDKFARTTIEMVALAAEKDVSQRTAAESAERRRRRLWLAIGALALAASAFIGARTFMPSQNRALIADLPTIARIDELTQVGDIDFLRGLVKLNIQQYVGDDEGRLHAVDLDIPAAPWQDPGSRRQWVERLSADQKEELAGRLERFESLPAPEQRKLRDLEQQIADAKDSVVLLKTLDAYGEWLGVRSQATQADLRGRDPVDRIDRVRAIVMRGDRLSGRKLSAEEEQALREALAKFTDDHREELVKEIPREGGPRENGGPARDSSWWRRPENRPAANMLIAWRAISDDRFRDELHKQLTGALSPANREYFDGLTTTGQMQQMAQWVRAATNLKIDPEAMEHFFLEKLSADQREVLMNLPQPEMQNRLERWYVAYQSGLPVERWSSIELPRGIFGRGGGPGMRDRENGPPRRGESGRDFGPGRLDRGPGGRPRDGRPPDEPPRGDDGQHGPPPDNHDQPPDHDRPPGYSPPQSP
jgi:anti-sigma factor RsiW